MDQKAKVVPETLHDLLFLQDMSVVLKLRNSFFCDYCHSWRPVLGTIHNKHIKDMDLHEYVILLKGS